MACCLRGQESERPLPAVSSSRDHVIQLECWSWLTLWRSRSRSGHETPLAAEPGLEQPFAMHSTAQHVHPTEQQPQFGSCSMVQCETAHLRFLARHQDGRRFARIARLQFGLWSLPTHQSEILRLLPSLASPSAVDQFLAQKLCPKLRRIVPFELLLPGRSVRSQPQSCAI